MGDFQQISDCCWEEFARLDSGLACQSSGACRVRAGARKYGERGHLAISRDEHRPAWQLACAPPWCTQRVGWIRGFPRRRPTVVLETERSTPLSTGFRVLSSTPTRLVRFQDSLVPVETVEQEQDIDFVLSYRWENTFEHAGSMYNKSFLHVPVPRGRVCVDILDHLHVPQSLSQVVAYMGVARRGVPTTRMEQAKKGLDAEAANRGWMFQEQLFGPENLAGNRTALRFWIQKYLLGGVECHADSEAGQRYTVRAVQRLPRNSGYLRQCRSAALANAVLAAFTYDADRVAPSMGIRARERTGAVRCTACSTPCGTWARGPRASSTRRSGPPSRRESGAVRRAEPRMWCTSSGERSGAGGGGVWVPASCQSS